MSNFEKIKSMTIDEMAKFFCGGDRACKGCGFRNNPCLCSDSIEVHRKWLESEAWGEKTR